MDSNAIPVSENTTVIVKASGDLFLSGEESTAVKFMSSEDRIRVNQTNDTLYVETHASLDLVVPRRVKVIVEKVGGSAFMQDLESDLVVQKIGGDLAMRRLGNVRIEKVGGGCLIEGIASALAIHKIGGDLTLREAAGSVAISSVGGDCDIQAMGNGAEGCRAGGDLHLYITEALSEPVSVAAGGDVWLYVPSGASAKFRLDSGGETIELNLAGQGQQEIESHRYEFATGENGPLVEARAGGDIHISDETIEPSPIGAELDRRESAWEDAREHRGIPSWTGGFGFDRTSAWADMISRRAQEASRRAEQRAQSAMRRTEEQIRAAAERDLNREFGRGRGPRWEWGTPPVPPVPPVPPAAEPVSESERMMVLKMLQEGKLTIEQADQLLAALEGRYHKE